MKWFALMLGAALAAGVDSFTQAADLPQIAPGSPPTYYPVPPVWSGAYAGFNLGGGLENGMWADALDGLSDRARHVGVLGGGQAGYDYQFHALVVGIEGAVSGADLWARSVDAAGIGYGVETHWTATATGRIGYDYVGRLLYAKGGFAAGDSRETVTVPTIGTATIAAARIGWTIGAGIEFPLSRNWSARFEYDFLDFGLHLLDVTLPPLGPVSSGSTLAIQSITVGINYRF